MRDRDLYARILGLQAPWIVTDVELKLEEGEVEVRVGHASDVALHCPVCGKEAPGYDYKERRWRHLDTCQYHTVLNAIVPRVECPEHGVKQIAVPWAEGGSRFTALYECLVIDWLKEASIAAVARHLGLSWDEVDGIMGRAVQRGLAKRANDAAPRTGVDETSFQKRHEYVTVVGDLDTSEVLYVADDRKAESLDGYFKELSPEQLERIEVVATDMWAPYIKSMKRFIPNAEEKIVFDKFHVAKHLGEAVDKVRRAEHRELRWSGDDRLKGTRYLWLQNPENMKPQQWDDLNRLRKSTLRTARAWAIKEFAATLWNYRSKGWARRAWNRWLNWALRCRLEPIKRVARMIRTHLEGIINAIVYQATNAGCESINARIQKVKRMACGFRNRERFRNAIYFHLGGLELYPSTHTIA